MSILRLTGPQRRQLRAQIEQELSEKELISIFSTYPGKFGANFYNQIPGGEYRTRLVNVIIELTNKELISDFIQAVYQKYGTELVVS